MWNFFQKRRVQKKLDSFVSKIRSRWWKFVVIAAGELNLCSIIVSGIRHFFSHKHVIRCNQNAALNHICKATYTYMHNVICFRRSTGTRSMGPMSSTEHCLIEGDFPTPLRYSALTRDIFSKSGLPLNNVLRVVTYKNCTV